MFLEKIEYRKIVAYWLFSLLFILFVIILVGGLTRLTDSGLSITKWDLISGILPPMSLSDWEKSFLLYKQIPEYKLLNFSMTLEQFKTIYWWEYAHRLLGRLIGLLYVIPLVYFTIKKVFKKRTLLSLYIIFFLICFQGFIGWYMVKSGLTDRTDVSHYRLALHLSLAFIILILTFWNYLNFTYKKNLRINIKIPYFLPNVFLFTLLIQIILGAFVSGLDAGQIYNTWPLMNNGYFPDDSSLKDLLSIQALETPSIVQFIHRNIAYFIIFLFILIFVIIYKNKDFIYLRNTTLLVLIFLFLQTILGILTVLSGAHIVLASMHQIGSIFLIITSLVLVFKNSRTN